MQAANQEPGCEFELIPPLFFKFCHEDLVMEMILEDSGVRTKSAVGFKESGRLSGSASRLS